MLINGDCLDILPQLDAESIDSCVTDPPYGLAFMGKDWDHGVPGEHFWREVSRVLKPGAHLLAFGGTRTFHRLTCAIEDAGFEIRDCLMWLYGSGFPKSLDVSKAIDKAAGAERPRVPGGQCGTNTILGSRKSGEAISGEAISGDAIKWQGWGTALKPAWEPIILARKPLIGTVAANVEKYGTGAVNVDGCRIGTNKDVPASPRRAVQGPAYGDLSHCSDDSSGFDPNIGRWPANLILDEDAAALLDEQTGTLTSGSGVKTKAGSAQGNGRTLGRLVSTYDKDGTGGDSGGASRFFYCAKASRSERNAGLDGMDERITDDGRQTPIDNPYLRGETKRSNHHPTVKPLALMRYLCRLVTPPGGTVLDPFMGSGSTGCGAVQEGFDFIGIEQNEEYIEIAQRRIEHWSKQEQQTSFEV